MSDSVDRVFVHALNTVKRIPRTGTARPPAAERLKLYGLYKQSMETTEGDVEGVMDRPIGNTPEVHAECEKWDAWYAQRGLSRTEAKRRYISTLVDTMHRYASQTSEARELVSELEFVWDQIKFNASSSSSSSPLHNVGVPPLSGSTYGSIGGRLARSSEDYERPDLRADTSRRGAHDSRLRVLSPVSQPEEEEYYRRRRVRSADDDDVDDEDDDDQETEEDEEEDDEEYEEARDSLYEDPDHASTNTDTGTGTDRTASHGEDRHGRGRHRRHHQSVDSSGSGLGGGNPKDSRWRRRVEQALTKMTAEIAAVREQMEARTVAQRRRSGLFAWVKWLLWVALRQIVMDIALLGMLLIWMRMRGDRRVENRLRTGWSEVKARLGRFKLLKRIGAATPMLP
ncbi:hypothetical protein N7474_000513 [Penicillium riverlandense]|uniref:uncharacterized protein n=1 Tax=Penicillium riverlandense TaxID=1903569 RepID=UPI0025480C14|nr:uncharacterized protein N7474_000513 [Penicillium riverlandense]KAJ5832202.1 hypothetical protein N7474_000513 [Penicillium riverlandense]